MSNKSQLYTKILNVISKMEAIEKSGYNSHQKYSYSTEEDLVNGIRQLLIDNKLVLLTSSETKEIIKLNKTDKNSASGTKETLVAVVNTTHKLIDAETGEFDTVTSTGTGWDDTDKMTFKAITGALKYFIGKNFLVPTKDDPENDGEVKSAPVEPRKGFGRGPAKVTPDLKVDGAKQDTTITVQVSGPNEKGEHVTTVVDTTKQVSLTGPVASAAPVNPPIKNKFGSRTVSKQEPKFP